MFFLQNFIMTGHERHIIEEKQDVALIPVISGGQTSYIILSVGMGKLYTPVLQGRVHTHLKQKKQKQ